MERTPLLGDPLLDEANALALDPSEEPQYGSELLLLLRASFAIASSFALQNFVQASSILIVGGLGTFELGVTSYGYMFASSTGSMIALGGATALDTLCSQAITSVKPEERAFVLRNYLQRGVLVLATFYTLVIVPLWWFSGRLFVVLGQEEDFATATGMFLKVLIPGGLLQVVAECLKKFLQVQGHSFPTSYAIAVAAAIGLVANVLFVQVFHLGYLGAPLAHTAYHSSTLLLLLAYTSSIPDTVPCWVGFSRGKLRDWKRFANLAITGIFTQAAESFSFEILAMMAARLDQVAIGAQGIIMASDMILYTIPLGISVASSHRIGNLLGAANIKGLKFALRMPYILSLIIGIFEFILVMLVRNSFGYLFSDDEPVVRLTAQVLPIIALFQVLDLSNNGACGILRGAGKVHFVLYSNIVAYYGVGMSTAWYFCFKLDMGLFGLWGGLVTGSAVLVVVQTLFVLWVDFEKEAEIVSQQDHGHLSD